MINQSQKLNTKLFETDVEKKSVREGFGEGLLLAGALDVNVVGLCADLKDSTKMNLFADKYPERFIEVGVAEQNLAGVASGMAAMGKIPFMASYAMFSPGRNWEQIRTTICYNNVPVKIIGSHVGVSVGPDGGTHQALEDIALMRVLPNMAVVSPCDAIEARKATLAAAQTKDPTYIRLTRHKTPIITTDDSPFEIGKAYVVYDSQFNDSEELKKSVGIIATGSLVYQALLTAQILAREGIGVTVLNLPTIKPLDEAMVVALARKTNAIVTAEEHQITGGMGSAVSEVLAQHYPVPMEFVGVQNRFGQSGTPEELLKEYSVDEVSIKKAVLRVLKRKNL